jgi:hypothetical protein
MQNQTERTKTYRLQFCVIGFTGAKSRWFSQKAAKSRGSPAWSGKYRRTRLFVLMLGDRAYALCAGRPRTQRQGHLAGLAVGTRFYRRLSGGEALYAKLREPQRRASSSLSESHRSRQLEKRRFQTEARIRWVQFSAGRATLCMYAPRCDMLMVRSCGAGR